MVFDTNSQLQEDLKRRLAQRWLDPVARIEDIFNVRTSKGELIKMKVPEPQKVLLREGILGTGRKLVDMGQVHMSVINKGRQLGFSTIVAAEQILICEDFPNARVYYIATRGERAKEWMEAVEQLCKDANHYPPELGGGPILNITSLKLAFEKTINDTKIIGLAANPAGIRGSNAVSVVLDEMAWMIRFKNQMKATWQSVRYFVRQGGSLRCLSTPRITDDQFYRMFDKPEKHGMVAYYCPAIENWRDLDLEMPLFVDLDNERRKLRKLSPLTMEEQQKLIDKYKNEPGFKFHSDDNSIQQPAIIPYPWVKLADLELERAGDLEEFKQESLGIPIDETYKLIKSEWIYQNCIEEGDREGEWMNRGDSENEFFIFLDYAQRHDVTAITIVEKIGDTFYERLVAETQDTYDLQVDEIIGYVLAFRPQKIIGDDNGHGIVIHDLLIRKLSEMGWPPNTVQRTQFTSLSKQKMAEGFKALVQSSRYKFLNIHKVHASAIRHVLRVEKIVMKTHVKYSGKMHGRDDHFWSKAQVALIETEEGGHLQSSFGRLKHKLLATVPKYSSVASKFLADRNKQMIEQRKVPFDDMKLNEEEEKKTFNIRKARHYLLRGMLVCDERKQMVRPVECCDCNVMSCRHYTYHKDICKKLEVTRDDVWKYHKRNIGPDSKPGKTKQ